MAREDAADEARWEAIKAAEEAKKAEEMAAKVGATKVWAAPAALDQNPPWWKFWDRDWTLKDAWKDFWTLNPQKSTPNQPRIPTSAIQTAWAQITQTMQVALTPTPLANNPATALTTPTPTLKQMVVLADGLNLRVEPDPWAASILYEGLRRGSTVYIDHTIRPTVSEGYCWVRATYHDPFINTLAIASSPQFLDPLANFKLITGQGTPIGYNNAVPGWEGRHIGNDFAPLPNTDANPLIIASANGIVTNSGNQSSGYGNYVIIEYPSSSLPDPIKLLPDYIDGKSLYVVYAHLLNNVSASVKPGSQVQQGTAIGNMGASGNAGNFTHLHLEIRLGDANQNLNASNGDWYNASKLPPIDPALIITPNDTWTGWIAESQWDPQLNFNFGDPYLASP